jgi:hypothetical protein
MLVAKTVAFDLYRSAVALAEKVVTKDTKLAKDLEKTAGQLVDAVTEGSGRFRGDRTYFFECAYASGEELEGKLEKAEIRGVLSARELEETRALLDREKGLLWGLTKRKK